MKSTILRLIASAIILIILVACGSDIFGSNVPPAATPGSGSGGINGAAGAGTLPTEQPTSQIGLNDNPVLIPSITPTASANSTAIPNPGGYPTLGPNDYNAPPAPPTTRTPTPIPQPGQPSQPTQAPQLTQPPQAGNGQIVFAPGTDSTTVRTNLTPNVPQDYTLVAQGGQTLYIAASGNFVTLVFDPQGNEMRHRTFKRGATGIALPSSGTYTIRLAGSGPAVLVVSIPGGTQTQQGPTQVNRPAILWRVQFAPGSTSATIPLNLAPGVPQGLVLYAGPDREMFIATSGNANATLLDPRGAVVQPINNNGQWYYPLGPVGDYVVVLNGSGPVQVTTTIPAV